MARSIALLTGAFAVAAAQSTTLNLFLPLFDPQDLQASVVGVKGAATTLALACPTDADEVECGLGNLKPTVVAGESTFSYEWTVSDEEFGTATQAYDCKMTPSKFVVDCTITVNGEVDDVTMDSSTVMSTTVDPTDYKSVLVPVTVTAGANKLDDSAPASTTGVSKPTNTASEAESTESGSASESGSESGSESTAATTSDATSDAIATPTDNAAGPMVTNNAIMVGVAAVVGGAAMLL